MFRISLTLVLPSVRIKTIFCYNHNSHCNFLVMLVCLMDNAHKEDGKTNIRGRAFIWENFLNQNHLLYNMAIATSQNPPLEDAAYIAWCHGQGIQPGIGEDGRVILNDTPLFLGIRDAAGAVPRRTYVGNASKGSTNNLGDQLEYSLGYKIGIDYVLSRLDMGRKIFLAQLKP